MRLSELTGVRVYDADGVPVGRVTDLRLVQDGPPMQPGGLAALRLDGVVVGGGFGTRLLGYEHRPVDGPLVLRRLVALLQRETRFADWAHVRGYRPGRIELSVRRAELPMIRDVDIE
jgi:hypothetical protein